MQAFARFPRIIRRLRFSTVCLLVPPALAEEPTKSHVLFLGADLSVAEEGDFFAVDRVENHWFVAETATGEVRIAKDRPGFSFRFDRNLKLADNDAILTDFHSEAAYTPANDPGRRWLESQALAVSGISDTLNAATRRLSATVAADNQRAALLSNPNTRPEVRAALAAEPAPDLAGAERDFSATVFSTASDQFDPGFYARRLNASRTEQHDALELSFQVTPRSPLTAPHLVAVAEFSLPDDSDPRVRRRVIAEPLPPLPAGPTPVRIVTGNFPAGYRLENLQVHLYDHGREVATNRSERRLELTADEAWQFLIVDHVSRHRDAVVAPAMAADVMSPTLRSRFSTATAPDPSDVFVRVTPEGRVAGVFTDSDCTKPHPGAVAWEELKFLPAVERGRAVAGVVRLRLNDR